MLDPNLMTAAARASSLVLQMTITVVLGFFIGSWLDGKLGTSPLFLLGLGLLGLITGFWQMNQALNKARQKNDRDDAP